MAHNAEVVAALAVHLVEGNDIDVERPQINIYIYIYQFAKYSGAMRLNQLAGQNRLGMINCRFPSPPPDRSSAVFSIGEWVPN